MGKKLLFSEFKSRVDSIFNNTINLDNFNFINTSTKGLCKCNVCGYTWEVVPNSLLHGHGCRKCYDKRNSNIRKMSLEDVQDILNENGSDIEIIGNYINTKHKCLLRCKICGRIWEGYVRDYFKGGGCSLCKSGRLTTDILIKKLQEIHGDKYLYDKVKYVNSKTKITLICKKHGSFDILISTALKNHNEKCKLCIKEEHERKLLIKKTQLQIKNKIPKTIKKKEKKIITFDKNKLTSEQFINLCKQVYQNEPYDYGVTEYINSKTKIKVKCLKHGIFEKQPYSFLKGCKCPLCSRTGHKYTTKEWVKLAQDKFPEYDYSKVNYVNKEVPVIIICNKVDENGEKHGEFKVYPNTFLRNGGKCLKCEKEKRRLRKEIKFIEKSKIIHNNFYQYNKVKYVDSNTKVCVICPKHGEFWVNPNNHIRGVDCPKCAIEKAKDKHKKNNEIFQKRFIERSNKIHKYKYSYDKVIYVGNEHKVIITCPIHGDFEQTPHSHLSGQGCIKCGIEKNANLIRLTQEEFIKRVREKHKYKNYDFSKVVYKGYNENVSVICPKHGEFSTKAMNLLNGCGCPVCRLSRLENEIRNKLIDNNINYIKQKRFKSWLGKQSLDFYLPDYNIAIECQGIQHFKNDKFYNHLEVIQERDLKKKRLCNENNVHLIYYVPEIYSQYMKDDDIFFTKSDILIEYIKSFNYNVNK